MVKNKGEGWVGGWGGGEMGGVRCIKREGLGE